jgi:hypothetical protein
MFFSKIVLGESPRKWPFEIKKQPNVYYHEEPPVKKPKLSLRYAYFNLGLCHAHRIPDENARSV